MNVISSLLSPVAILQDWDRYADLCMAFLSYYLLGFLLHAAKQEANGCPHLPDDQADPEQ